MTAVSVLVGTVDSSCSGLLLELLLSFQTPGASGVRQDREYTPDAGVETRGAESRFNLKQDDAQC